MTWDFPYAKAMIEESQRHFVSSPPTHDWMHTQRVLELCMHMGKEEGADLEVLFAAALLHDIARDEADSHGTCHADLSAEQALPLLEQCNFPKEKREAVIHCIKAHRFRGDIQPQTLEAEVLFDADKLDALGAIGVCRAYAYAGENKQRLYSALDERTQLKKVTNHAQHSPVAEFRLKLGKLKDRMFTRSGKRLAAERHEFMLNFFNRLYEEIKGIK
jgi:uncharacterized protein